MNKSAPLPPARPTLNHWVFWPPFLLLALAIVLNFVNQQLYLGSIQWLNDWILDHFGWLFIGVAAASVVMCIVVSVSPLNRVRLGGDQAEPLMSRWNWFAITICTTIAIGILFWSAAEPVTHLVRPPVELNLEPESPAARVFSLSTMYFHWSFTPYAIYCVASLTFAFAYYNMRQPFSLGATLAPLVGRQVPVPLGRTIDAVCLYSLVAGMSAALGTGIMMIGGGLQDLFNIESNRWLWLAISTAIVGTFIVSSATGLMKGIRILSDINTKLLFLLVLVPVVCGPGLILVTDGGAALAMIVWRHRELDITDQPQDAAASDL